LELPWDLELGIWSFQRVKLLEHFLRMENVPTMKPRVVIVGAGFGGLEAAKKLACQDVDLTVIDRTNYHLFQPLLYQVATAALSPADIAAPVRGV
jgi:NADH:ubiquinone reductase (H+-translocating)